MRQKTACLMASPHNTSEGAGSQMHSLDCLEEDDDEDILEIQVNDKQQLI